MITLTNFYLKAALKLIGLLFIASLCLMLVFKVMPGIEPKEKEVFFIFCIKYLMPLYYFFSQKALIASNLDWVLLTPVKKSHVIFANGIVNICKVILFIIFADLITYLYSFDINDLFVIHIAEVINEALEWDFTTITFFINIIFLSFFILICFGMIRARARRARGDYKFPHFKLNLKTLKTISCILLFGFAGLLAAPYLIDHLPGLLILSGFYAFALSAGIVTTLDAVNFKQSKMSKNLNLVLITFILMTAVLTLLCYRDINSPTLAVQSKQRILGLLGPHLFNAKAIIVEQIKNGHSSLNEMEPRILRMSLDDMDDKTKKSIKENWIKLCLERKDFVCSLAADLMGHGEENPSRLDLVRPACPRDLRSCFIIYAATKNYDKVGSQEKLQIVAAACKDKDKILKENKWMCKDYHRYHSKGFL
jgi:hypothetical protein